MEPAVLNGYPQLPHDELMGEAAERPIHVIYTQGVLYVYESGPDQH